MLKVLFIFGTRPEAIKMAPVINTLKKHPKLRLKICVTAQHRKMLDQVLNLFQIKPDYDLNLMRKNQSLNNLSSEIMLKIKPVFKKFNPDIVFVHGDTTTTLFTSLAAYYEKIPVAHIEAGLRTNNIYSPWPEEINRKLTGHIAKFHFSPTISSKRNLINEGINKNNIVVTGNTVIDALFWTLNKIKKNKNFSKKFNLKFNFLNFKKKIILVTGHRRENFGVGFLNICKSLATIAKEYENVQIVYPVHLNPNVQKPVFKLLKKYKNIFLLKPLEYSEFIFFMDKSYLIISDSGGIQEEAPSIGKPVLVLRDVTERPEAVKAGTVKLVGTNPKKIIKETKKLLSNKKTYDKMKYSYNPYGDGKASKRILNFLIKRIK